MTNEESRDAALRRKQGVSLTPLCASELRRIADIMEVLNLDGAEVGPTKPIDLWSADSFLGCLIWDGECYFFHSSLDWRRPPEPEEGSEDDTYPVKDEDPGDYGSLPGPSYPYWNRPGLLIRHLGEVDAMLRKVQDEWLDTSKEEWGDYHRYYGILRSAAFYLRKHFNLEE